jgi:hypothetical protein
MEEPVSEARIDQQSSGSTVYHVYPIEEREHVTSGAAGASGGCWCGPDLYRLCTACDGDDPDCWACEGYGIVEIDAIVPGDRILVVHHFIPDDATFVMD